MTMLQLVDGELLPLLWLHGNNVLAALVAALSHCLLLLFGVRPDGETRELSSSRLAARSLVLRFRTARRKVDSY